MFNICGKVKWILEINRGIMFHTLLVSILSKSWISEGVSGRYVLMTLVIVDSTAWSKRRML